MDDYQDVKVVGTNWTTTYAKVKTGYHSAYTKVNPNWRWWKPWIERFVSVPAGYSATFYIGGKITLSEKPLFIN